MNVAALIDRWAPEEVVKNGVAKKLAVKNQGQARALPWRTP